MATDQSSTELGRELALYLEASGDPKRANDVRMLYRSLAAARVTLGTLHRDNARMREALRPFAHAAYEADGYPDNEAFTLVLRPDDEDGLLDPGERRESLITARQLRAAREAVA